MIDTLPDHVELVSAEEVGRRIGRPGSTVRNWARRDQRHNPGLFPPFPPARMGSSLYEWGLVRAWLDRISFVSESKKVGD